MLPTQSRPHDSSLGLAAPHPWRLTPLTRTDLLLALALAAAALLARWPFIARGETLLHSDEAIVGLMAQDIREAARFPIFFYGQRYMGALEAYVVAAFLPLVHDPITALRLAPACFFAALVAAQYLMLTRWFNRKAGLIAALALIACAPAFLQWSISARGGYIEILLWGTLLWWTYTEWFLSPPYKGGAGGGRLASNQPPAPLGTVSPNPQSRRLALFGFLLGSGLWINPSIVVFAAPIMLHALLNRPLAAMRLAIGRHFPRSILALPLALLAAVSVFTAIWSVWVDQGRVRHQLLLGLLPPPIAAGLLVLCATAAAIWAIRCTTLLAVLRAQTARLAPFILATLAGLAPTFLYTFRHLASRQSVEPTVPLGLRPLGTIGETLHYLAIGLRLLLAADMRPYTDLVCVGRARPDLPLPDHLAAAMPAVNLVALGALLSLALLFCMRYRQELSEMLRLRPGPNGPAAFLVLALASVLGLYILGGCTFNLPTIRYLVPIFAVLPGLLAAAISGQRSAVSGQPDLLGTGHWALGTVSRKPQSLAPTLCAAALLTAWSLGQYALHEQLGPPHPLHRVADALKASHAEFAVAEILDAHLLSYLTQQHPPVAEYEAFWPRLAHYRTRMPPAGPYCYVVHAVDIDWMTDWTRHPWPGPPPPETTRLLWPRLKQLQCDHPQEVVSRVPLADGYELWTLRHPLAGTMPCAREAPVSPMACAK